MRLLLAAFIWLCSLPVFGQNYTVVTASSGGDIGEIIYRVSLSKISTTPDLSPGGDGLIAPNKFAQKPQGNYLLFSGLLTQQVVNPATRSEMVRYTDADFTPVTLLASTFFVVLANRKIDPFAPGSNHQVAVSGGNALFLLQVVSGKSGAALSPVAYKNISQGIVDMMRGDVSFSLVQASTAHPFIESGRAYGIATTAPTRVAGMQNIPTLSEQFPGLVIPAAWGLYGQKHTTESEVAELVSRVRLALSSADAVRTYRDNFLQMPERLGPQALRDYVTQQRKDYQRFSGGAKVQ